MERTEAALMHSTLGDELANAEQEARHWAERADALRQLIQGFERLFPDLASEGTPSIAAAVDASYPNRWYTVSEVTGMLLAKGWHPNSANPEDAVRASLNRAAAHGPLSRKEDGRQLRYGYGSAASVEDTFFSRTLAAVKESES